MSIVVSIPTQLRSLTGGSAQVTATGATVGEIVAHLAHTHPGISERLLDESGDLRRFVNVYLDDENVRFLDGLSTPVAEGSKISIIPAVAGGAL